MAPWGGGTGQSRWGAPCRVTAGGRRGGGRRVGAARFVYTPWWDWWVVVRGVRSPVRRIGSFGKV